MEANPDQAQQILTNRREQHRGNMLLNLEGIKFHQSPLREIELKARVYSSLGFRFILRLSDLSQAGHLTKCVVENIGRQVHLVFGGGKWGNKTEHRSPPAHA